MSLEGAWANMENRKAIVNEYKKRRLRGGVYTVTNVRSGKYLIDHAADLKSAQNRFQFALATGMAFHPKMRKDWEELSAQAFTFEVCEELEQKPAQSQAEFMNDLETLEQLWRANLDASKEY